MTLCCGLASAQTTKQEVVDKYNLLTGKLGLDGVGVETLLTKWEAMGYTFASLDELPEV